MQRLFGPAALMPIVENQCMLMQEFLASCERPTDGGDEQGMRPTAHHLVMQLYLISDMKYPFKSSPFVFLSGSALTSGFWNGGRKRLRG